MALDQQLGLALLWLVGTLLAHRDGDIYLEQLRTLHNNTVADEINDDNRGLPLKCREDACPEETVVDEYKGTFKWPRVVMGTRAYHRCPYSTNDSDVTYVYRDCQLSESYPNVSSFPALWTHSHSETDACPFPPFVEVLRDIAEQEGKKASQSPDWYHSSLTTLYETWLTYPDLPIFYKDLKHWMVFLSDMVRASLDVAAAGNTIPRDDVKKLITLSSFALEQKWRQPLGSVERAVKELFLGSLARLAEVINTEEILQEAVFISENVILQIMKLKETPAVVELHQNFQFTADRTAFLPKVNVTISEERFDELLVSILCLRDAAVLLNHDHQDEMFIPKAAPTQPSRDLRYEDSSSAHSYSTSKVLPPPASATADDYRFTTYKIQPDPERGEWVVDLKPMGPLVYVGINTDSPVAPSSVTVDVVSQPYPMDLVRDLAETRCAVARPSTLASSVPNSPGIFYNASCKEDLLDVDAGLVHCHCSDTGFVTLIASSKVWNHFENSSTSILPVSPEAIIDTFLGFPYRRCLYYFSITFKSCSLACLLATMLTFLWFRKTRRGSATLILLNLCGALCCMIVMFLIAEPLVDSETGCRAANVLRYYLILVTLMWNGVEGVNMYLLFIWVFNSDIFLWRAALAAWGGPVLIVAVAFAIDEDAFGGYYDGCRFRCGLHGDMLYFGYLLPMCVLIAVNLAIFSMVYRVMIKHQNDTSKGEQPPRGSRLLGAVSVMVLLGVPWVFSAFGAINADDDDGESDLKVLEGVFQVIFVVFVNLQGVFIFVFYCIRRKSVRTHWRSLLCARGAADTVDNTAIELHETLYGQEQTQSDEVDNDRATAASTSLLYTHHEQPSTRTT